MFFLGWTAWLTQTFGRRPRRERRRTYRPRMEGLENRWVPTILGQPGTIPALTEGAPSPTLTVATFTTTDSGPPPASAFTAQIDWGDGASSAGTITQSGPTYSVTGVHTYAEESAANTPYMVTVSIHDTTDNSNSSVQSSAAVGDAVLTASGVGFNANEQNSFTGTVATFTDANPFASLSDYTATIDWGDGTSSSGTVGGASGSNTVSGTHTYAEEGTHQVRTTIVDDGGFQAVATSTATVKEADLTVTVNPQSATEGTSFSGVIATFTDPSSPDSAGSFSAAIDWGDGTVDTGSISGANGSFVVNGGHNYADEGDFTIKVTVTETGVPGNPSSGTATATVAEADVLNATGTTFSATEGSLFSGAVATFTDAYTAAPASDFAVTIDWGDGSSSNGAVTGSGGSYTVNGDHVYSEEGTFNVLVTIRDDGPGTEQATAASTATVAEGDVLAGTGIQFSGTEAQSFSGTVATFTDQDAVTPASGFSATINWGDGTPNTSGSVSGSAGNFTVSGVHTYAEEGIFTVTVTLRDNAPGTAQAAANSTATINEGNLVVTPTPIVATEGQAFNGQVALFTDVGSTELAGSFTATINWGDGTTNTGTVGGVAGAFTVSGSHTYMDEGTFNVTITVTEVGAPSGTSSGSGTATVGEGDVLGSSATNINATEGQAFNGQVATFTTTFLANTGADFSATIDWGDNTAPTSGTITGGSGNFTVTGSHVYADEGNFNAKVTIRDNAPGTAQTVASAAATVAEGDTLSSSGLNLNAGEKQVFSGVVANFTSNFAANLGADFTASINWGDGNTTSGVVAGTNGAFSVSGAHTYTEEGTFNVTVTIQDDGAGTATTTANSTMIVAETDLTVSAQAISTIEGQAFNGQVATFTDTGSIDPAGSFSASIDWGDGQTSQGTVASSGPGAFTVSGSHTYADEGSFTVKVTVTEQGTPPFNASGSAVATVAEGDTLTATAVAINGFERTGFNGQVASFTTTYAANTAADFSASIDWGDGTTTAGVIAGSAGSFTVSGSHTYMEEGKFTVKVTVNDNAPGTATASATNTATVQEELLPGGVRGTPNQRFISETYRDLLGRQVDSTGLNAFTNFMASGGSRLQVVQILENTQEYRTIAVQSASNLYLHRPADPLLLSAGLQFLAAGGTMEQFASILAGSPEYFQGRGGSTNDGFLDALYSDALKRTVDQGGRTFWDNQLKNGITRQQVAFAILTGDEYRRLFINGLYVQALDRQADTAGRETMLGLMRQGQRDEFILALLMSSQEFFDKTSA
jgi:hypothetical protein